MLCWTLDVLPDYVVALGVIVFWNIAAIGPSAASLSGFASPVWFLLLGVLAVGGGLTRSGVLQRVAFALLTLFPATFRGQAVAFLVGGLVMTPLLPLTVARCALTAPLARQVAAVLGYPAGSRGVVGIGLAAFTGSSLLSRVFLSGAHPTSRGRGGVRRSTGRRAGGAPCAVRLDGQLIADRQATDPLAGRGEDRIAQRRRDRRHTRLAHTAHRLPVILARDDVDPNLFRRPADAGHLVGVEVVLLDTPGLVADFPERRDADAHDGGTFHLRSHTLRIDGRAAVHRDVDPRNRQRSLGVDGDLHDRGDVAHEAVVAGDAHPLPLGQLLAPAGRMGRHLDDAAQAPGIDRIALGRLAVVPGVAEHLGTDDPRWADDLQQEILRVAARRRGQFGHERLHRERMRDVRDRPEPADPRVGDRLRVLDADVGDRERHVDDAHAELEGRLVLRVDVEGREDRRRDGPVQPRHRRAPLVDAGLEMLDRHRVVVGVVQIVVARPRDLDRLAVNGLRQNGCLDAVIRLGLAPEAAAQQGDVHG